jgi:hypothetical protein
MDHDQKALSTLAVAFTTIKAMVHFHKAGNVEWPDRIACNVVKSLIRKCQLQDMISGIEYKNTLRSFKLKKNEDPTKLFNHFME